MKINEKLNLVIPLERDCGAAYVHSTPISREVFASFYRVLKRTCDVITDNGSNLEGMFITGPAIALLALEDMAGKDGWQAVQKGFINEIRRISSFLFIGNAGWETMPLADAISRNLIDTDELNEVESRIVFFTVILYLFSKAQQEFMIPSMIAICALRSTSSNSTDFAASLPISTPAETSDVPLS